MVVYFENISVYRCDEASRMEHLPQVFHVLRQKMLCAKHKKCELFIFQVIFIEYVVSRGGIQVDRKAFSYINGHTQIKTQDLSLIHI